MQHPGSSLSQNKREEKQMTLRTPDHPTSLQKQLHKQWLQGQNCDLAISTGSCRLPVHSCVVSCFSAKISHHLLQASSLSTVQSQYSAAEDGVVYCFPNSGEKKVGVSVREDLLKALVGYMYTGSLSVKYSQTVALLRAAHLLNFQFVVNIMEIFIRRNPDVLRYQMAPASGLDCATEEISQIPAAESTEQAPHTEGGMRHGSVSGDHQSHCPSQCNAPAQLFGADKNCSEVPQNISGLNIKQEIIDPDLQENCTEVLQDISGLNVKQEIIAPGLQENCSEVAQDVSGLNVKQEIIDPGLKELLAFPSVSNESSLPETQPQEESRGHEDSVETLDTVKSRVVIKQEVLDCEDFPGMVSDKGETLQDATSGAESDLALSVHSDVTSEVSPTPEDFHDRKLKSVASAESKNKKRTNKRVRQCKLCGSQHESMDMLFQHLRDEHGKECFPCQQCPETFLRQMALTKHARKKHECRSWMCSHCDEVFTIAEQFSAHCRVKHNDWKPFRCQETSSCRFRSDRLSNLDIHKQSVHAKETKAVMCHECGKWFATKIYLLRHQVRCLKLQQHLCSVCGKIFPLLSSLKAHVDYKHRGQRRQRRYFTCTQCGRRLSDLKGYKVHMRIHNNVFPYLCEICGEKFRQTNSLNYHVRTKHE